MSTTPNLGLTLLTAGQLQPEVTINQDLNILDSVGAPMLAFANNPNTTTGLTYGYYGGKIYSNGANIAIANGTIALAASVTNYVQRTAAGIVSVNSTGFTAGLIPMATVVTGASTITTITDARPASSDLRGRQVIAVAATNITLTDAQVNARILSFQGTLTANVVVTFPAYQQEWIVSNETTGAFSLQVQTAGGSPLTVLQGTARAVYGNGTLVKPADNASPGYIDGLQMQWVSATAVTVSSGRAYIPSLGYCLDVPNAIALTGLALTASTFYHLYLYNNSGTPAIECVTTVPAAPYSGTARAKTGDTSRRYIGSVLTDGSGNLWYFQQSGNRISYGWGGAGSSPQRPLSSGTATTATAVNLGVGVPVTAATATLRGTNSDPSQGIRIANSLIPGAVGSSGVGTNFLYAVAPASNVIIDTFMDSSQSILYWFVSTPTVNFAIDIFGYTYER